MKWLKWVKWVAVGFRCSPFFTTNQGRLKLRHLIGTDAQLVYYDRSDKEGPKLSDYHIVTTDQPDELSKVLSKALGVRGEVMSKNTSYF